MSELEEAVKKMSEFGLTPYEAQVYLAAVRLGQTTASSISKFASIRREEVYRTLPKLEKSGLIDKILGKPVTIRAVPVREALTILIGQREKEAQREIAQLATKSEEFLASFEPGSVHPIEDNGSSHFVLVSERNALLARFESLLGHADSSVDMVDSSDNVIRFLMQYGDLLHEASKRKVKVRVVTQCPYDEELIPSAVEKHLHGTQIDIRYLEGNQGRYGIFDGVQAIMAASAEGNMPQGRFLWTDDRNLVGIMGRDFEDLITKASDYRTFRLSPSQKMDRVIQSLKPRDHVILVYSSIEAKHDTLFRYLDDGLQKGEAARYICSEESASDIRQAMTDFGLQVARFEDNGALDVIDYTDFYIRDGKFSIVDTMNSWDKVYQDAMSDGFSGLRVTGEMACFIEHSLVDDLIEYEKALHTILDIPMRAICAYNANTLSQVDNSIDLYNVLVRAHGKVLFAEGDGNVGKLEMRKA